jgi:hypothetical protein
VVGWSVAATDTAEIARNLIDVTCTREHVGRNQLQIYSDRGAQMTSITLTELYDELAIRRSLSRPRVSNDNPHAEAGFKALKYRPDWPNRFDTLTDVTGHCEQFFGWSRSACTKRSVTSPPTTNTKAEATPSEPHAEPASTKPIKTAGHGTEPTETGHDPNTLDDPEPDRHDQHHKPAGNPNTRSETQPILSLRVRPTSLEPPIDRS